MTHAFRLVLPAAALLCLAATPSAAQIQASPRSTVSQTIDGTTITVDYSRPAARGRELFGALVPWNSVWTPGANWATTLEVDRDVRLNGVEVPEGKYSVWAIPRPDRFTITLNPEPEIFHFVKPDSADDQIHISAETEERPHAEMLTWSFPHVRGDAGVLLFQWGTTAVPLEILVQPTRPVELAEEIRKMYVGTYEMSFVEGIGFPQLTGDLRIWEEDGKLRGQLPFPIHPNDEPAWDLIPASDGQFNPGLYRGDTLFNVEMGLNVDFEVDVDRATGVEFRGPQGMLFAEGERKK